MKMYATCIFCGQKLCKAETGSGGLPQYFLSDNMKDDIVTSMGLEDKKLLLFDDFTCIDEGEIIGTMSRDTIEKMRKSN